MQALIQLFLRRSQSKGWVSPWQFGLNQGPIIIMIENYSIRAYLEYDEEMSAI